ncbi:MAG: hypothetical protein AB1726_06205 [Planctomycetota bacterium]
MSGPSAARALAALVLLATRPAAEENRAWPLALSLRGPLEEVVLDCGEEGRTRIELVLLPGETLELVVPVPVRPPGGAAGLARLVPPAVELRGGGAAVVQGWTLLSPAEDWASLPPGLRARPRPPVPGSALRAGAAELALVALAFVLGWGGRRKGVLGPAAGLGAGAAVLALTLARAPERAVVTLLEGDLGSGAWMAVRGARDTLEGVAGALERRPAGGAIEFRVRVEGAAVRTAARAPGAELFAVRPLADPERGAAGPFGLGVLDASWRRGADGRWRAEDGEPPAWLQSGLPAGVEALLGRRGPLEAAVWLRVAGPGAADRGEESD